MVFYEQMVTGFCLSHKSKLVDVYKGGLAAFMVSNISSTSGTVTSFRSGNVDDIQGGLFVISQIKDFQQMRH